MPDDVLACYLGLAERDIHRIAPSDCVQHDLSQNEMDNIE
jgi:hypothetical protein